LIQRQEQKDVDTPLLFEVERPFPSHSLLTLVVCNGAVHVLPNPHPGRLRMVVHLGASLRHELTSRRFLQEFAVGQKGAGCPILESLLIQGWETTYSMARKRRLIHRRWQRVVFMCLSV